MLGVSDVSRFCQSKIYRVDIKNRDLLWLNPLVTMSCVSEKNLSIGAKPGDTIVQAASLFGTANKAFGGVNGFWRAAFAALAELGPDGVKQKMKEVDHFEADDLRRLAEKLSPPDPKPAPGAAPAGNPVRRTRPKGVQVDR